MESLRSVVVVVMLLLGLFAASCASECEAVERDRTCEECDHEPRLESPRAAGSIEPATHEIVFAEVMEPPPGPCGPGVFHPPRRDQTSPV